LQVSSPEHAATQTLVVVQKEGVERLVIGLPLNMDDTIGPMARSTVAWGSTLAARAAIPVVFVDERLSSFSAEQGLNDRKRGGEKITRGRRKQMLDAIAATQFLQEFLDGKLAPISIEADEQR
jgi:putative Holliday junction resolvase